ncbi:amidohydrolase family protein [Cytophagaceae bacterium YF14B1]|uniref:Amidohydrolase family protein n=1 Tax=Xanthocytophaga flava TaxID=3048013 RepID=A0AAE3QK54_9BACT|nr:amidohydrolase family protein [Xanthocytophaga flavus]MDJ1478903.1 amidohydrolase family protein [Xanthocytophaga flavus]
MKLFRKSILFLFLVSGVPSLTTSGQTTILKNVTVIDGTGNKPRTNQNVEIKADKIVSITDAKTATSKGATVIDMTGKSIMPMVINSHGHLGNLKGTTTKRENFTHENIERQLVQYEKYGISAILSLGSDHAAIWNLRDSSRNGLLKGATIYTAGYGFGVANGAPPVDYGMDDVLRPQSAAEVPAMMQKLASLKPDMIKIWVDDLGGRSTKMEPAIYEAIIREAHKHNIRVAAHLYYLEDAKKLVAAGLDVIAHSIRDKEVDDALLTEMKKKGVIYIPTLSLDEFAFSYGNQPEWINDPFFKNTLEPGVFEMITSKAYQDKTASAPNYQKNISAFKTALINVKKIYNAGIMIALGTDSGANPIRPQGFSEHFEMGLLVQAGLTPLQAITIATQNSAIFLKVNTQMGTLAQGKKANFIVLDKDPSENIKNTQSIQSVWKNGKKVQDFQ